MTPTAILACRSDGVKFLKGAAFPQSKSLDKVSKGCVIFPVQLAQDRALLARSAGPMTGRRTRLYLGFLAGLAALAVCQWNPTRPFSSSSRGES